MPALKAAGSVFPANRIHSLPPSDTWASRTARSVTRWGRSGAVISVGGELDASNAGQLADYVQRCASYCEWLVLDLNDLEFIGTAGFSALKTITDRCADAMVYCTTVPGVAVSRLLRICDPGNAVPTMSSVADALAGVQGFRHVR
ncbi:MULTISPECIES: STAS domain-containing protein [Mycobacteriaceae]|uniref:STAS domain-containing protein n=1 Tax=[Mycobacterium] holstebronense TaxID=3064288 RepID=A0ABM9M098_9MYCO|nr:MULTISPECIES: STAS domain-containing protein [Mycolicibacter]CAJ1507868.1 STAS domain-containing protein [Mycolicibacter sp. MU0102]